MSPAKTAVLSFFCIVVDLSNDVQRLVCSPDAVGQVLTNWFARQTNAINRLMASQVLKRAEIAPRGEIDAHIRLSH